MDTTLDYYNKNAEQFVKGTLSVAFTDIQDRFLKRLDKHAHILDFGCGSGRDTLYFLDKGYEVDAVDGSEELCRIARETAGIAVRRMLFLDLNEQEKYDGIWACASILHVPKGELKLVFQKMEAALKPDGIVYTSFKYGEFEGRRNGRYFTDFTIEAFADFMGNVPGLELEEHWVTGDVRPGRGDEKWLNLMLRKSNTR